MKTVGNLGNWELDVKETSHITLSPLGVPTPPTGHDLSNTQPEIQAFYTRVYNTKSILMHLERIYSMIFWGTSQVYEMEANLIFRSII